MKIEKKPINFEDERGTITDIFVHEPIEHTTIITTRAGGVRGNHYHKVSVQHDYLVSGKFQVYSKMMDDGKISTFEWNPGDFITWEKSEAHEFVALEDSTFITFVNGVRGGEDFEKDTYRLETPLHITAQHS